MGAQGPGQWAPAPPSSGRGCLLAFSGRPSSDPEPGPGAQSAGVFLGLGRDWDPQLLAPASPLLPAAGLTGGGRFPAAASLVKNVFPSLHLLI